MNEYSHGDWQVTKWSGNPDIHVWMYDGRNMHFVANCGNPKPDSLLHNDDAEANANLISAAPKLLGELIEADETICKLCYIVNPQHATMDGVGCDSCEERERRLATIAKAKGETR